MIHPLRALAPLATALPLAGLLAALAPASVRAQSLFNAAELDQAKFILVAAPIGTGERAQLNIYEQRSNARPCFAVQGANPGQVNPLLATFDFTGICNRYIDANGYSLRVGGTDLATQYRLSVVRQNGDNQLLAIPTKPGAGAEMVVARTGGHASGFLLLVPEPGWKLMRRTFGGRALGHVYVYRDTLPGVPGAPAAAAPVPAAPVPVLPAAAPVAPAVKPPGAVVKPASARPAAVAAPAASKRP